MVKKQPKKSIKKNLAGIDLSRKAEEIMQIAQEYGAEKNFFFITTFDRYLFYIKQIERLKKEIDGADVLVSKEYVKGRKNMYENPAIKSYNSLCQQANNTALTIVRIINGLNKSDGKEGVPQEDPLLKALRG